MTQVRDALNPRAVAALGVAGVLILALGGRSGVAALSPIADEVELDLPLDGIWLALLGAIPPIAYAVSAWLTPRVVRRYNLEVVAIGVAVVTGLAHIGRGYAPAYWGLFLGTVILMLGVVGIMLFVALACLYADMGRGLQGYVTGLTMSIGNAKEM